MRFLRWIAIGGTVAIAVLAPASSSTAVAAGDNVALQWNAALLQAVRSTRTAPMISARALAVTHTCMYDAWAAYDESAIGVHWSSSLRRPPDEWTEENKAEAVSFAAHAA